MNHEIDCGLFLQPVLAGVEQHDLTRDGKEQVHLPNFLNSASMSA